jgi:hypothetical protein
MEYTVIEARDIYTLITRVNMNIRDRWVPLGGIAITAKNESKYENVKCCQAMTRSIPNKKD